MSSIENKLARIDLNLLVSLNVLLQEQSVSKAAERLYLSQSAMSRVLHRLRETFNDQLFTRTSNGIIPTVKALELGEKLPDLLIRLNEVVEEKSFIPATSEKSFSFAIPSLMSHALLLPFISKVSKLAPLICISEQQAIIDPLRHLLDGTLDFALHINQFKGDEYDSVSLGKVIPTIYAGKNHPILELKNVSVENCLAYNFGELVVADEIYKQFQHPFKKPLKGHKSKQRVTVRSSQLSILLQMLTSHNLLLIGSDFLYNSNDIKQLIQPVLTLKQPVEDSLEVYLISHKRIRDSAAHQWIKNQFLESIDKRILNKNV